jgi:dTDP-glucose pyrophosphorylase
MTSSAETQRVMGATRLGEPHAQSSLVVLKVCETVRGVCVDADISAQAAVRPMHQSAPRALLLVDPDNSLAGLLSEVQLRAALAEGPKSACLAHATPDPVIAPLGITIEAASQLAETCRAEHVVLVDSKGEVVDIVTPKAPPIVNAQALVMAGGLGLRLGWMTAATPKPMLKIGGRPLLERIISRLRTFGIAHISVSTHYAADVITQYFGAPHPDSELNLLREEQPLGTAGAIALVADSTSDLIVVNGDILTEVNFESLMRFHRVHQADLTVASVAREEQLAFGVLHSTGVIVNSFAEKPVSSYRVSAGMYVLSPAAQQCVPGRPCDMPDVINCLLRGGHKVIQYPVFEYWLDIGDRKRFEQALLDYAHELNAP